MLGTKVSLRNLSMTLRALDSPNPTLSVGTCKPQASLAGLSCLRGCGGSTSATSHFAAIGPSKMRSLWLGQASMQLPRTQELLYGSPPTQTQNRQRSL